MLSGYGAAARLARHELAVACGFPGKGDVRGPDVGDLWQAGDLARIRQDCPRDVLITALVYGRDATHRGWWDPAQADRFAASVRVWLAAQPDPDWAAFAAGRDPAARVAGPALAARHPRTGRRGRLAVRIPWTRSTWGGICPP